MKLLHEEFSQTKESVSTAVSTKTQSAKTIGDVRVVPLQRGSKTPFFFLHGDWTGNAFFCFKLARTLGPDQPFYALDTFNFERYQELPSLEAMAAEHLAIIREIQPEGPYLLGGFCNGGLIAYEMAHQLHLSGQKVDLLVLIDSIPPRCMRIRKVIKRVGSLLHLNQEQLLVCFLRLQHVFRYLTERHAEDYEFIKTFDPRIDTWFPPVETLRKEFPAMFIWATAEYKPTFYPGKVTLFWDEAEPVRRGWWQRMAEGHDAEVDVHIIPGSHKTCKTVQIDGMAECLQQCLLKKDISYVRETAISIN
jgi:thioesterase domain-containing protein